MVRSYLKRTGHVLLAQLPDMHPQPALLLRLDQNRKSSAQERRNPDKPVLQPRIFDYEPPGVAMRKSTTRLPKTVKMMDSSTAWHPRGLSCVGAAIASDRHQSRGISTWTFEHG